MLAVALVTIAAAMVLVRLGWSGRIQVALLGWLAAIVALAALVWREGAWGLAMGMMVGTVVAIASVLHAGWTAPGKLRRPVREAAPIARERWPTGMMRRAIVFVLVVPVGFAGAQWLAFGAQALVRGQGGAEADAAVLTLFLQPLIWAGLMAWQMTRSDPTRMVAAPASAAALGTLLWNVA